ncbi:MAG: hypothetical protein WCD04_21540 [Terriglobia bacterium]
MGERRRKGTAWLELRRSTANIAVLRKNVGRNETSSQEVQRFSGVLTRQAY